MPMWRTRKARLRAFCHDPESSDREWEVDVELPTRFLPPDLREVRLDLGDVVRPLVDFTGDLVGVGVPFAGYCLVQIQPLTAREVEPVLAAIRALLAEGGIPVEEPVATPTEDDIPEESLA